MNVFKILLLLLGINLVGCYTVVFSPDMKYPSEENFDEESFYPGGIVIVDYYTIPWWVGYEMPAVINRIPDLQTIRNQDGGRNPGEQRPPIIISSPTRNGDDQGGAQNSGSTQTNTKKETKNDNGDNNVRQKNDDSSQKNSIRNNDGSRSNDKKRK